MARYLRLRWSWVKVVAVVAVAVARAGGGLQAEFNLGKDIALSQKGRTGEKNTAQRTENDTGQGRADADYEVPVGYDTYSTLLGLTRWIWTCELIGWPRG